MNSIGQYSTGSLYSLYQAGQNGYASGQGSSSSSQAAKNAAPPPTGAGTQSSNSPNAPATGASVQDNMTGDAGTAATSVLSVESPTDNDSQTNPTGPFTNNTQANADYQSMVLNLGSGNLAAAAKDYAQLQTDLKLHSGAHHPASVQVDTNANSDTAGSVFSVTV